MNYQNEQTILKPASTSINIQAFLWDVNYIDQPNTYGEYSFSFQPLTYQDHQILFETVENAVRDIELKKGPYSKKLAKACCENRNGTPYCSQLFKPKLNIDPEHPSMLHGLPAKLKLHLRDDPTGRIYLQSDYIDVKDFEEEIEVQDPSEIDDDDF